ncbi:MAG: hypothetical protein HN731_13960 [Rhodospirillaceae bacterium]|nr:hypothetical protein [Rhodospirillaceae bacterium]
MIYHVFMLVWGERFVRDFVEVSLPYQCMAGNLPGLAQDGEVFYHIYTDHDSLAAFEPEVQVLSQYATPHFHLLDDMRVGKTPLLDWVKDLKGPEIKYEIQKRCVLHLTDRTLADPDSEIVLLDSNFILSEGTLANAATHMQDGAKAVNINFLRVNAESALPALKDALGNETPVDGRALVQVALDHPHHLQESFFVDAENFTSYPSQLCWRVADKGILAHAYIPHPLIVKSTPQIKTYQSTMDYDLVLRSWLDDDIYMCDGSDEMMVLKYSSPDHLAKRDGTAKITAQDLALFLITSTHQRHRIFGDVAVRYHVDEIDESWRDVEQAAAALLKSANQELEFILSNADKLDAKFLMHIKSHTGPIENYMSPALEPAALNKLGEEK